MSDKKMVCPECGDHEIEEFETHRLCLNCGWQEKRYKKLPTEDVSCPACKKLVILRTELPSNKKWYECYRCGLAGPFGETKEAAIANFRAIRIDRTVG